MENKIKVIVVEDNKVMCNNIVKALEKSEMYDVVFKTTDGLEALAKIVELKPNMIILDLILHNLDGISILENIKSLSSLKDTTKIVMSGTSDQDLINKAIDFGADDFLLKPYDISNLPNRLKRFHEGKMKDFIIKENKKDYLSKSISISNLLWDLKVSRNLKGYKYLYHAIKTCIEIYDLPKNIKNDIYSELSKLFDVPIYTIERNMRTAIRSSWKNNKEGYVEILNCGNVELRPPSISEFLLCAIDFLHKNKHMYK